MKLKGQSKNGEPTASEFNILTEIGSPEYKNSGEQENVETEVMKLLKHFFEISIYFVSGTAVLPVSDIPSHYTEIIQTITDFYN